MKRYKVWWTELIQHEAEVEATNGEEAIKTVRINNSDKMEGAGDWDWEEMDEEDYG